MGVKCIAAVHFSMSNKVESIEPRLFFSRKMIEFI